METSINRIGDTDITSAVKTIKAAILSSRYNAARLANREQLTLYSMLESISPIEAVWLIGGLMQLPLSQKFFSMNCQD